MNPKRGIPDNRPAVHLAWLSGMRASFGKMVLRAVIWGLLPIGLSSCRPDLTEQQQAVQSLLNVVSRVEATSNNIEARHIRRYMKDVEQTCIALHDQVHDTLDLETARELMRFCILEQHLSDCLQRKEQIDAELYRTRNQLYDLRSDLKGGRVNKDSVNVYIEQEFLFVESLQERSEQVIVELNSCFETYTELKQEIDRLLTHPQKEKQPS